MTVQPALHAEPAAPEKTTVLRVAMMALPVVLSNALQPLQGAIDTAIIGNLGETVPLAAVALGATAISMVFTSFNFLQIGVSGLSAQALGARNPARVANTLLRAFMIAAAISLVMILAQGPISRLLLLFFEATPETEALAYAYMTIRLWGAPGELGLYALIGWFAGQGRTRRLFELQVVVSCTNVALNLLFVIGLGWGVEGVALGTVIAVYLGVAYGLWRAVGRAREILPQGWRPDRARLFDREELIGVMALNRDVFIRTTLLMLSFGWVARLGSLQNDTVLAANGVLIQFFHVASAGLDGFAIAAEALVGHAKGAGSRAELRRAVIISTIAAGVLSVLMALALTVLAVPIIHLFTNVEEVRAVAAEYVLWASLIPIVGVLAFQADGIFIGASEGPAMRNTMIVSAGIYLPASWAMTVAFGNHGLWAGVWLFLILRAATLGACYPALERRVEAGSAGSDGI